MFEVQEWDIERLIPYARNPRKNDDAIPKLAGLIREFGFKVPIVARSDGEVIDGHLRLKAAKQLGLKKVPVVLADEWSPAQVKAFRIAVNKAAEWADWDEDLLKLELEDLKGLDFNLDLIGFDDIKLTEALEDITPEPFEKEDYSDMEESDEDLLATRRVIIVFKNEEELFIRKLFKLTPDENIALLYKADDLAAKYENQ